MTGKARVDGVLLDFGILMYLPNALLVFGNRRLMDESQIDLQSLAEAAEALRVDGETAMFVAADGRAAGFIGVADPIKQTTPEAIQQLRREKFGSSATAAQRLAAVERKLGIDDCRRRGWGFRRS
jgi:Cu+-exporting ATPase